MIEAKTPSLMKTRPIPIPIQKRKKKEITQNEETQSAVIARNATRPSRTRRKSPLHPRKSTYPDEPAVPPYESYLHSPPTYSPRYRVGAGYPSTPPVVDRGPPTRRDPDRGNRRAGCACWQRRTVRAGRAFHEYNW